MRNHRRAYSAPDALPFPPVVTNPVADRRRRIRGQQEEEVRLTRESPNQIVRCPADEDVLKDILSKAPREPCHRRPGNHLHVSDLLSKCVRKIALCDRFGTPVRPQRLTPADVLVFAQGEAIHDAVKDMAGKGSPANIWGKWSCNCGYLYHEEPCTLAELDMNEVC